MPIDFESRFRNPGKDFESRFRPTGPGATPDNPLNEQGVDELERFTVNTVAPDMRSAAAWLKNRGYEAVPMADENNVAVRKGGGPWKKLEPSGFWNSIFTGDFVKDLTSDAFDEHAEGAAMAGGAFGAGLLASPTGPGAVAAGMAGAGAGAAAARTARHAAGVAAGFEDDIGSAATDIALSGAMGAAGEGLGRAIGYGGKKLLNKWRGKPLPDVNDIDPALADKVLRGEVDSSVLGQMDDIRRGVNLEAEREATWAGKQAKDTPYMTRMEPSGEQVMGRVRADSPGGTKKVQMDRFRAVPNESLEQLDELKRAEASRVGNIRGDTPDHAATRLDPKWRKNQPSDFGQTEEEVVKHLKRRGPESIREMADGAGIRGALTNPDIEAVMAEMVKKHARVAGTLQDKRFALWRIMGELTEERLRQGDSAPVLEGIFREADDTMRHMIFSLTAPKTAGMIPSKVFKEVFESAHGRPKDAVEMVAKFVANYQAAKGRASDWPVQALIDGVKPIELYGQKMALTEMTLSQLAKAAEAYQPIGPKFGLGSVIDRKKWGVDVVWDYAAETWRTLNRDGLWGLRAPYKEWIDLRDLKPGGWARVAGSGIAALGRGLKAVGRGITGQVNVPFKIAGTAGAGPRAYIRHAAELPGRIVETLGNKLIRDDGTMLSRILRGGHAPPLVEVELTKLQRTLRRHGPRAARAALFVLLKENQELGDYLQQMELEPQQP
jgi:hypothetical protein